MSARETDLADDTGRVAKAYTQRETSFNKYRLTSSVWVCHFR